MPPFESPALARPAAVSGAVPSGAPSFGAVGPGAAAPGAAGPDLAVEPESLHAAARQLRQAAEALPAAAQRLRIALSTAAGVAGGSRSAPVLAEHADVTSSAVGALTERVLALARALDAGAVTYRGADANAVRGDGDGVVAVPSQRRPR